MPFFWLTLRTSLHLTLPVFGTHCEAHSKHSINADCLSSDYATRHITANQFQTGLVSYVQLACTES